MGATNSKAKKAVSKKPSSKKKTTPPSSAKSSPKINVRANEPIHGKNTNIKVHNEGVHGVGVGGLYSYSGFIASKSSQKR